MPVGAKRGRVTIAVSSQGLPSAIAAFPLCDSVTWSLSASHTLAVWLNIADPRIFASALVSQEAVYLHSAVKYHKRTRRPSQGQKGLDERAILSSQRPSHPCGRPRRRPCGRTSSAWATSPCRSPRALLAHTPAGCGHGGTRKSRTARTLQTWPVNPAAIAGGHGRHCVAAPVPWVGRGGSSGGRKAAGGRQK